VVQREQQASFEALPPVVRRLPAFCLCAEVSSPKTKLFPHLGWGCDPQQFAATLGHVSEEAGGWHFGVLARERVLHISIKRRRPATLVFLPLIANNGRG
jgi:hypothetical protein